MLSDAQEARIPTTGCKEAIMFRLVFPFLFSLSVAVAAATEIYQWRDQQGRIHYGDRPPDNAIRIVPEVTRPDQQQLDRHRTTQDKMKHAADEEQTLRVRRERARMLERRKQLRAKQQQQRRCELARQRLEQEQERWQRQRRKGYRNEARSKHRAQRAKLEYRVNQECGG